MPPYIQQLRDQHASLASIVKEMATLLPEGSARAAEIHSLRWRLCRELLTHLATEDTILYPALLNSSDQAVSGTAKRFVVEMGTLGQAFRDYIADWPSERISSDWNGFRRATSAILDALTQRIRRENTELYPLAENPRAGSERNPALRH